MLVGLGAVPFVAPAMAAYVCPACYGLQRLGDLVFVDPAMSPSDRARVLSTVADAQARVVAFYGSFDRAPVLLVCATATCERRLGGRGAKAVAYGSSFVRVSPAGMDSVILAHEFSHIELHARVGDFRLLIGAVPAWFDEGLAVIVSDDPRFLKPGETGSARCLVEPREDLPTGMWEWGRKAGARDDLYAPAACRVLRWMDAHGGRAGVLDAISNMAAGESLRV